MRAMFRKKKHQETDEPEIPVPAMLPPVEGLDDAEQDTPARHPRTWLWTLVAALIVGLLVVYVVGLGVLGVYDGLKDRAIENRRVAQEHYTLGLSQLEAGDYELAIAEFQLALDHDPNLTDARTHLREAKDLAKAVITPTSQTRQDAAELLYRQAVAHFESGNLDQAVMVLDELRGLDAEFERQNVQTMLVTAHYQLGLNAVMQDRMDEAGTHFQTVLDLDPEYKDAQDQLNLVHLYSAALNHWGGDWSATAQALKGLYALAPEYKDVQARLHDAYSFLAQDYATAGDWCQAADEYAAAAEILPQEATIDLRDDARAHCQATAEAPTPAPTSEAATRPTADALGTAPAAAATVPAGAAATAPAAAAGNGLIAFPSFDAVRQRHDVYILDLAQGAARLLQENATQPAFAPDGSQLAFHNLDPQHLGLGVIDLSQGTIGDVTAHPEDSVPEWSPDGSQLLFASNKHGDRKWRIYVISPYSTRGEGEEWIYGERPDWSHDGNLIAYRGCDERGNNCGIWVMKPGGFGPTPLTTNANDTAPAWSPDASQLAFISTRAGNWEIYLVDVATGRETRLTDNAAVDVAPAWSPDGKQLAFLSNRSGCWMVYVLQVRTGQVSEVIATGDPYPDPVSERLSWIR
jgi:tetratricopeptide (TPR) repeat protein